jgi:hypothetical protein
VDLTQIQHVIEDLPAAEQTALAAWIVDRDRARWDEEIERDFSSGGAGMELLDRVKKQVSDGLARPLSQGRISDGSTPEEALKNGRDAVQSYLLSCA